ncbi:hypothetical protein [Agrobacterium pusense]|uniref:hypothetical protein n=1 Tax=Agrobacterium pusense TaxID=648995 RepID=UPI000D1BEAC3|nr:hypothetical protein [Agrobacterium pusense]
MTFKFKNIHAWTETGEDGVDVLHVCEGSTEKPFASFPKTHKGAVDFMAFMEKAMHGHSENAT